MSTLHIHLDESGEFDFTPRATKFFVFAAAWTYQPKLLAERLTTLRFRFLREGKNVSHFHASEDTPEVKAKVVETLLEYKLWGYAATVVEKRKVPPSGQDKDYFYPKYAAGPLLYAMKRRTPNTDRIIICADRLPGNPDFPYIEKAIKAVVGVYLPPGLTYHFFAHPSASNTWLQVADYCCWCVRRKWEKRDPAMYNQLRPRLHAPEWDVLASLSTFYY